MAWGRRRLRNRRTKRSHGRASVTGERKVEEVQLVGKWDRSKTVKQNYERLGLQVDPNKPQAAPVDPVDLKSADPPGEKEKYLTLAEIVNCREMIMKHGDDYLKMWRDIKLNHHQLTRSKLKKKCELYMERYAYRDPLFKK